MINNSFHFYLKYIHISRCMDLSDIEEDQQQMNNNTSKEKEKEKDREKDEFIQSSTEEDSLHIHLDNLTEENIKSVSKLLEFNMNYFHDVYEGDIERIIDQYG